ncbi:hypothetical protein BO70DRAFT_324957 [Aspergillus heteromorphus CBS 117.55]|uniref:Uncharacterized protein n=1 Tax=Aspergillus heteromorphus CBS 117.55 TaxID=1448321 RepID=A0A317UUG6_9EURO|nr:uncharacterized protein BO70DRAFT_324957 [Aspergillus heteromorphus CBS 117.55]PWY65245.1 hypothetical protein BO70DRAFT_324957 [Aspergillus heteromorphus CBS 117.55]
MADVRSLLRSELAARKGSSQTGSSGNRVTKKRKVDPADDLMRKRMRSTSTPSGQSSPHTVQPPSARAIEEEEEEDIEETEQDIAGPELPPDTTREQEPADATAQPSEMPPVASEQPTEKTQTVDEDEWAAFERDVVAPTRMPHRPAALSAEATISAAPVTAEELAAQQAKEHESMKKGREAEAEGEREDAARLLEDEFDEMEQLEERVRRLKHMREELRKMKTAEDPGTHEMDESPAVVPSEDQHNHAESNKNNDDEDDEDDDDDYDDDWDNWRFK